MNTLNISVILVDDSGYQEIKRLSFPRTWSYEERTDFVQRLGTVLCRQVHIYESDKRAFESGITNAEHEELWYQHTLNELAAIDYRDKDIWEQQEYNDRMNREGKDFNDARGDV